MRISRLLAGLAVAAVSATLACPLVASAAPTGRIINGWDVSVARHDSMWPFLVSIGTTGASAVNSHYCGGALINARLVLTAAHCVDSWDEEGEYSVRSIPSSISVFAGTPSLRAQGSGQRRVVRDVIVHPKWNSAAFRNDLALLRLATPMQLTSTVGITKVVAASEDSWWGAGAGMAESAARGPWAAGWGNVKAWNSGESYPATLREVAFPVASDAACASEDTPGLGWLDGGIDTSQFFCAGRPDSDDQAANGTTGADTCQGDSGGPLMVGDGLGSWRLFGLVSNGDVCGGASYGAYTRVSSYRSWIASVAPGANGAGGIRPVRGLRVTKRTRTSVTVAWTAPIGGAASYAGYGDIGDGGALRWATSRQRSMRFTDLDPGSSYVAFVAARSSAGNESSWRRVVLRTRS